MKVCIGNSAGASLVLLLGVMMRDAGVEIVDVPTISITARPPVPDIRGWELKAPHERTYGPQKRRKKGKVARW